jgi:UDP-glucose 4-epimerase
MSKHHHLLIGGSGFIGRHTGLMLAAQGLRVTLAGRSRALMNWPAPLAANIFWKTIDVFNTDWDAAIGDAGTIHYYAWGSLPATANADPGLDLQRNAGALIAMLDAIKRRGYGTVVFASSGGTIYGKPLHLPVREDHATAPLSAYGAGKAAAEIYLGLYHAMHGLDFRIARIANPYGAGQDISRGLGAVTTFLHKALTGQTIEIWGTGETVRDYIHIADVAACLAAFATLPAAANTVLNVGTAKGVSLNQIILELEFRLGRDLPVVRKPARGFDVPVNVLSIDRARDVLGWAPKLSFSDGLARTMADLAAQTPLSSLHVALPVAQAAVAALT